MVPLVYPHIVLFSGSPNSASLPILRERRIICRTYGYFLWTSELCVFVAISLIVRFTQKFRGNPVLRNYIVRQSKPDIEA